MCAGGLWGHVLGDREASEDPAGVFRAAQSFRVVPHIEARSQTFEPPVSTTHGRREGNLEGGSSL